MDIDFEQANRLVADHVKFAHPTISSDNLNVNKGSEGGNFVNSSLHNPTFNIHTPAAAPPPPKIRQQLSRDYDIHYYSTTSELEQNYDYAIYYGSGESRRISNDAYPTRRSKSRLKLKHWATCFIISIILATFLIYILVLLVDFILYHHIIAEVVEDEIEEKNRLSQIEFTRQQ